MRNRTRQQLAATLLAGAAMLLAWNAAKHAQPAQALAALSRALGRLPLGARLAGVPEPSISGPVPQRIDRWPAAALRPVSRSTGMPRSRHAVRLRAAIDLYRGAPDSAVARLEPALTDRPRDPYLLNDLAASYLVLAHSDPARAAAHLSRAIEHATLAAEQRGTWPEPRRNRQAALEALGIASPGAVVLGRPAPLAPEDVLPLDEPGCRTLVLERTQAVRELMEVALPSAWAARQLSNDPARARYLAAFDCVARARAAAFGDRFFADAAAAIAREGTAGRRALADGHLAYARGRAAYDAGRREDALAQFARAREVFAAAGSSFQHEARLQAAIVVYQMRRLEEALRDLQALRTLAGARGYPPLAARSSWIAALVHMQRGRIEDSVDAHEAARTEYERLREPENAASVANSEADTLRVSGDFARGWPLLTQAARSFTQFRSAQRQYLVLFNLSLYAQDEGLWRAAEAFQTAAVAAADRRGHVLTMIESRLRRAQLVLRRGADRAARADLASAGELLRDVRSSASAAYLAAWRERLRIAISERQDPAAASRAFESLVARFEGTEPAEIPSLYLQAARAARLGRNIPRATELLRRGIAFARERRALLDEPEYRIASFATAWDLSHDLIDLEISRDSIAALRIADEGRAWLASNGSPNGAAVATASAALPDDAAILYYAVLRHRLAVWIIARDSVKVRSIPYDADRLAADALAWRRAIAADRTDDISTMARALYTRVLAPALELAPAATRLLIAPDGPLGDVPFALLIDPASGRHVVDLYETSYIPALATLTPGGAGRPTSILAVGYNGVPAGRAPPLRATEIEAKSVAAFYPQRTVLTGTRASAQTVGDLVRGRDVLHIAAHAEANRQAPWNSQLWLASDRTGTSGALGFSEAAAWDLQACAVVVLSACETATGSGVRGPGVISFAGPFLSAGARAVVGTLWRVDDRASALFTPGLHARIARGMPPAAALREAQAAALRSDDPNLSAPSMWGAWVVLTRVVARDR